eukprot:618398-Ditylum_brightwellii.AAC.1
MLRTILGVGGPAPYLFQYSNWLTIKLVFQIHCPPNHCNRKSQVDPQAPPYQAKSNLDNHIKFFWINYRG